MTDEFDRMIWAYKSVFTQTNAGGGVIRINIIANSRTLFLNGMFGPDNWAADRTIEGQLADSLGAIIGNVLFDSPLDNEQIPMWSPAVATLVDNQGLDFNQRILLGQGDFLRYTISTPVQSETVRMVIRALIDSVKPTVTTAGSGGTVTSTVGYDKVI